MSDTVWLAIIGVVAMVVKELCDWLRERRSSAKIDTVKVTVGQVASKAKIRESRLAERVVATAESLATVATDAAEKIADKVYESARSVAASVRQSASEVAGKVEAKHSEMMGKLAENTALTKETAKSTDGMKDALVDAVKNASFLAGEKSGRQDAEDMAAGDSTPLPPAVSDGIDVPVGPPAKASIKLGVPA